MGGALGGVGGIAGKFITCGSKLGNAIQTTSKISGAISNSMDGFDMVSLGLGMIDPNNPITELNNKMHQSDVYNKFQMGGKLGIFVLRCCFSEYGVLCCWYIGTYNCWSARY